jgi:hypothetical protein
MGYSLWVGSETGSKTPGREAGMDKRQIAELTSPEHLDAELKEIFTHRLEVLVGTAQAYKTDESPVAGKKLADLLETLQQATEEAGADRLVTIYPLLVELVADSIVELMAENNRRIIDLLKKN